MCPPSAAPLNREGGERAGDVVGSIQEVHTFFFPFSQRGVEAHAGGQEGGGGGGGGCPALFFLLRCRLFLTPWPKAPLHHTHFGKHKNWTLPFALQAKQKRKSHGVLWGEKS